jgi:hypothetical protein
MAPQGDVWVSRHEGKWAVKLEGNDAPESVHATQDEAAKHGRELARRNQSELLIQGEDGQIQERNTYGHDPADTAG